MATTSSEDVLIQMPEVRYKKNDGILYVMNERLVWMENNRDTVTISHRFQDIKMQKISPDGKPKIQLQVILHNGNNSIFHFVNHNGQMAQIIDRDKIKNLLQQLLPNFKRKFNKELEEKNRILSENPNLLQLYKDLVITQILTSEEFWTTHVKTYMEKKKMKKDAANKNQEIGVSGAFLSDIKPQTDGCNGLKYNLTPDIIYCIFKTYPSVKLKYNEYVPTKLNESEFWMKFFQSHYYHRDRITTTTTSTTTTTTGIKDIFAECGKIDDQAIKLAAIQEQQQQGSKNPLFNLKQFEDDTNLDDDFGGIDKNCTINSGNIVHQNIIKRFNQHSIMVLKTSTEITKSLSPSSPASSSSSSPGSTSTSSPTTSSSSPTSIEIKNTSSKDSNLNVNIKKKHKIINDNNNCHSAPSTSSSTTIRHKEVSSPSTAKRQKIFEKIYYNDLGQPNVNVNDFNNETDLMAMPQNNQLQNLNLDKIERYFHGPVPVNNNDIYNNIDNEQSRHELEMTQMQILNDSIESWGQRIPHKILVNSKSAVNVLGELSPGGALMRGVGFQKQSLVSELIPLDVEKELRNLYLSLSELLWHFWHSFPPTTPDLEVKAVHMYEALQRFKMAKLIPFEDRSMRELSSSSLGGVGGGASLTQHLNQMLQSAAQKFGKWQERKMRQHRFTDETLI